MPSSLSQIAATEIRAEMGRQRISQTHLAKKLGRSQTYVWRRLVGEVPFDLHELETVAEVLGVPVTRFVPDPAASAA